MLLFQPPANIAEDLGSISSVFYVGQAVARHMIARRRGKIINIASVQSELARPGIAPYTATKGAVRNLTRGMCADWAKHGLQINAIAPGYFKTPLNQALVDNPEFSAWLSKRTPAGRWGNVEELVGAAVFLAGRGLILRQRTHALCRWRHHYLPLKASLIVVMGVSGCGKILGRRSASPRSSACAFVEGDTLHPRGKRREDVAGHTAHRRRPLALARSDRRGHRQAREEGRGHRRDCCSALKTHPIAIGCGRRRAGRLCLRLPGGIAQCPVGPDGRPSGAFLSGRLARQPVGDAGKSGRRGAAWSLSTSMLRSTGSSIGR